MTALIPFFSFSNAHHHHRQHSHRKVLAGLRVTPASPTLHVSFPSCSGMSGFRSASDVRVLWKIVKKTNIAKNIQSPPNHILCVPKTQSGDVGEREIGSKKTLEIQLGPNLVRPEDLRRSRLGRHSPAGETN
jgi:hypothetical protein